MLVGIDVQSKWVSNDGKTQSVTTPTGDKYFNFDSKNAKFLEVGTRFFAITETRKKKSDGSEYEAIVKVAKTEEELLQEGKSQSKEPAPSSSEISPQERGMWWKEIGALICNNKLEEVFGVNDAPIVKRAYKLQAILSLEITTKKTEQP